MDGVFRNIDNHSTILCKIIQKRSQRNECGFVWTPQEPAIRSPLGPSSQPILQHLREPDLDPPVQVQSQAANNRESEAEPTQSAAKKIKAMLGGRYEFICTQPANILLIVIDVK